MSGWPSLRVNVHRLRQRERHRELRQAGADVDTIDVEEQVVAEGLEITTARVPDGTTVHVVGRVTGGINGLEAHLRVDAAWEGECRRCVDPVTEPIALEIDATFLEDPEAATDDDADAYPVDGDWIDLGDVVREELMLALPLSPLCAEDCEGADPERFPTDGSDQDPSDEAPEPDPRWAALSQLTFDDD